MNELFVNVIVNLHRQYILQSLCVFLFYSSIQTVYAIRYASYRCYNSQHRDMAG